METIKLLKIGLEAFKYWHNEVTSRRLEHLINDFDAENVKESFKDKIKEIEKAKIFEVKKN